jgi:hypothetical protein
MRFFREVFYVYNMYYIVEEPFNIRIAPELSRRGSLVLKIKQKERYC